MLPPPANSPKPPFRDPGLLQTASPEPCSVFPAAPAITAVNVIVNPVTAVARQLPFADATFDVIVSLNVLHNIARGDERAKALTEIVRVLRPGGRVLISDLQNIGQYVQVLRENGISDARRRPETSLNTF